MKAVILAFYNVYPPESGAASVSYNIAKFLSGERYLFELDRSSFERALDRDFWLVAFAYHSDKPLRKIRDLLRQIPIMLDKIRSIQPDVLIIEGASWTLYYLFFLRRLKASGTKTKVVYHAHNVEYLLRKQKNSRLVVCLTRWAEKRLLKKCDLAFAVSSVDADQFQKLYQVTPQILPNGVNTEMFEQVSDKEIQDVRQRYALDGKIVLFMGLTSFKPNEEAIRFLIEEVFPGVVEKVPEARLAIIGGKVNFEREWLINPGNIPFTDVPAFIKACDVCAAPIFSGSGTRLKILEYLAAKKPVVSTGKGAEGLALEEGRDIVIADDAPEFIEKTARLLMNSDLSRKVAEEGWRAVRETYSWKKILGDFERAITLPQ
jgi:glycosyltransferase involved in cell wall biosynthesis